jgi:predicted AlkP superfamily pyrophosphatase or phosphodiesterase
MTRFIFAMFTSLLIAATAFCQEAKHVVLISIDGFRPEFYLDDSWPAPNLRKLVSGGASANGVRTVVPSVTYPSHTTLVTGALPARHGVYYNSPRNATHGQWYWEESHIQTATLWDAVKRSGLTSGAIMWPVTVGAPIDYNFPVRRPNNDEDGDQLSVTRPLVTPPNLLQEIEQSEKRKFKRSDLNHENMDKTIGMMANHILTRHKPHLMAIHFLSMDHAGHEYGREGAHVREALVLVDSLIGAVVSTIGKTGMKENTTLIITGDHGMVDRTSGLAPNVWLAKHGLLKGDDWSAKFHPAGGAAFLYLRNKNDQATLLKVNEMLEHLPASERKLFRVVNRKELDAMGADPEPVLALAFSKGVVFNNAEDGEAVRSVKAGGTHGYFADFPDIMTGFIASGAGIRPGARVEQIGIEDIAPLVAHLLGLNFQARDGKLQHQILKN